MNEAFRAIERDLSQALSLVKVTEVITATVYAPGFGEVTRGAPPSTGQRLILPEPNLGRLGTKNVYVQEAATGALTVEVVNGTINGATTLAYLAGLGTVEFILTPTGWYAWSASLITIPLTSLASQASDTFVGNVTAGAAIPTAVALSTLAGAGLAFASHTLDVTGSTSITITSDQVQRAALTGEATAGANANALTVTRSTDYATTPWTGNHQFNAEVRLGTLHTESNKSGALSVTLTAGSTRLLVTSTNDITLGTVSGCADGRVLIFEHVEASGAPNTLTVTNDIGAANAFACPGEVNLAIVGRGGFIAVGRQGANANWKIVATTN